MPCLCGAIDCPSCGPAQGYSKCQQCGLWDCEDDAHGYDPHFGEDEAYDRANNMGEFDD